ncbi:MAG: GHMP kinase [Thiotrichales bacterium]|nr:GHMP kinase [Thiotrichales bacterium]
MSPIPPYDSAFVCRAPANTMLMGEHSVVYGYPALACALEQWLEIVWHPIDHTQIVIESALATHQFALDAFEDHPQLRFVCAAFKHFHLPLQQAGQGWHLTIQSQFSSTIGLGSSAAVLAAMLVGLNRLCQTHCSLTELWQLGKKIIVQIQGRGSATDLAAALFGGLVYFQPPSAGKPLQIEHFAIQMPLLLLYSGYKTPTAEVLSQVAQAWQTRPQQRDQLYRQMGLRTQAAYHALQTQNWSDFYQQLNAYHPLMRELGVSDSTLENLLHSLQKCPQVRACKISGSGLGDCVLAVGSIERPAHGTAHALLSSCPDAEALDHFFQLQLLISPQGAHCALLTP